MRSFRSRPVGWRGESHRHYLAGKGVSTSRFVRHKQYFAGEGLDEFEDAMRNKNNDVREVELVNEWNDLKRERDQVLARINSGVPGARDELAMIDRRFDEINAETGRLIAARKAGKNSGSVFTREYNASKDNSIDWKKAPPGVKYDFYGIDSKGRRVRLYGKAHSAKASSSKFARIARLNKKYDSIEGSVKRDLDVKDDSKRENARATYVILKTGLRPGSEKDTKADVDASGLTTLNDDEVVVSGSTSRFKFVGKKGVKIDKSVRDPTLARIVKEQKRLKGDDLFPNISDSSVRSYVRKFGAFKTKDFRTLYANKLAKGLVKKGVPKKQVVAKVAVELQNTPSVASGSYIDPKVFS